MKAFLLQDYSSGKLVRQDLPLPPPPGPDEVQLKLIGTSLNPVDKLISTGYGAPLFNPKQRFPLLLGRDAVASVLLTGEKINDLRHGQRVLVASSPRTGGSYAEIFNVPRRCLTSIDDRLSDTVAAGIGYAGLTALQALDALGIQADNAKGKCLCINGASGGVGSIALLLATRWGAKVTAVSSAKHFPWVKAIAPCIPVDYRDSAAIRCIQADLVLNCATPTTDERLSQDPLMSVVQASNAPYRAYTTTNPPLLTYVTRYGTLSGLALSGAEFLRRYQKLRRKGIHYSWVTFRENASQLAYLANFFSQTDIPSVIRTQKPLNSLASHFNETSPIRSAGKTVFLIDG